MILIDDNTRLSSHDFDYTVNIVAYEFRDRATLWKGYTVYVWKVIGIHDVQVICRGDVVTWASPPTSLRIIWIVWMYNRSFIFFSIRPLFEPDLYKFIYLNIYIHISLSLFLITWYVSLNIYFWKKKNVEDIRIFGGKHSRKESLSKYC